MARPPPSILRATARAFTSSNETFALPSIVDVVYDVNDAERALVEHGFAPRAVETSTSSASDSQDSAVSFIGFDVETRPSYARGQRNPPALVQLANERACVLVHLGAMRSGPHGGVPPTLRALCEDASTMKVGNGVLNDMHDLDRWYGWASRGFVDTGVVALAHGIKRHGLKATSARYGYAAEKPKSVQTSNWEKAPLDRRQINYGAIDAALGLWVLERMHGEYGDQVDLAKWAMSFANASTPAEARRRSRRDSATPACVTKAFDDFDVREREAVRERWMQRKMKRAMSVLSHALEGAIDHLNAASALTGMLQAPKVNSTVKWVIQEQDPAKQTFSVRLELGSTTKGSGEAKSIKVAKRQAAKSAFDELVRGKAQDADFIERWLRRELEHAYSRGNTG